MSYVKSNLIENEEVLYEANVSLWSLSGCIFWGVILLPLYGFGLIFLLYAATAYYTTELAVTNKRVIAKWGFIKRTTVEMRLNKAESIQVKQSVMGRIFNFGCIVVSGAGNPQAPIRNISDPIMFRKNFLKIQESNEA
jgi:uncharacterized membrane protein YdbT with pleckstrin-like domain